METKEGDVPPVEGVGGDGKRTAILVIHGVGEQNPFDVLDGFVCGLHKFLRTVNAESMVSHIIKKGEAVGGGNWNESFIQFDTKALGHAYHMDVHECYWADLTEKKISVAEVFAWMLATFWGARKLRKNLLKMTAGDEKKNIVKMSEDIRSKGYSFFHMLLIGYITPIALLLVAALLVALLTFNPYGFFGAGYSLREMIEENVGKGAAGLAILYGLLRIKPIASYVKSQLSTALTEYLGDFVIYTTTDEKSSHFQLRRQILARTQSLLENMLKDDKYDRVIVAGHSLGSVIAYDVLNRINIKANLEPEALPVGKIAGLITFGSPLDKVALFFGQHAEKNQHVRRQIIEQLYSFRAVPLDPARNAFKVENPIDQKLDASREPLDPFPWVNYWSDLDPISGSLDFYKPLENVHLDVKGRFGSAHVNYWKTDKMYEHIVSHFLD